MAVEVCVEDESENYQIRVGWTSGENCCVHSIIISCGPFGFCLVLERKLTSCFDKRRGKKVKLCGPTTRNSRKLLLNGKTLFLHRVMSQGARDDSTQPVHLIPVLNFRCDANCVNGFLRFSPFSTASVAKF